MPTTSRWLFEPITLPVTDALADLLGKQIEYLTDEGTWEDVYLVGFNTHTLKTQSFTMQGPYVEVLPLPETDFGKRWHEANRPTVNLFSGIINNPQPAPIKVFLASRLRMKEVDDEPTRAIDEPTLMIEEA